jgi:hypothetical protein
MPLLHLQPFVIRIVHDGAFTDSYSVDFAKDPGGEIVQSLSVPVSELSGGKVEKSVTLPFGNYLGLVRAIGPSGTTAGDPVPVPIFAPLPGKPILVIVTT